MDTIIMTLQSMVVDDIMFNRFPRNPRDTYPFIKTIHKSYHTNLR